MSDLTNRLFAQGLEHKGTELGGLLQWAALHIGDQDEALSEALSDIEHHKTERLKLETAISLAQTSLETVLKAIQHTKVTEMDFGRDLVSHINIMAAHGDPDYLRKNGMSVRHVDCRSTKTRSKSE